MIAPPDLYHCATEAVTGQFNVKLHETNQKNTLTHALRAQVDVGEVDACTDKIVCGPQKKHNLRHTAVDADALHQHAHLIGEG